jgi:hypothetical protein
MASEDYPMAKPDNAEAILKEEEAFVFCRKIIL